MPRTAHDLVVNIEALISMPNTYVQVQELMDNPTSSIDDFATIIQYDPALTARLLRIVNSAFFGYPSTIDTLSRAVNMLGMSQLHDLVLANSAIQSVSKLPFETINKLDFWRDSIHCAVLCRLLAQQCHVLEDERMFVAGLLHQLGYIVICTEEPEKASQIIEQALTHTKPRHDIEREVLGFNYAEVGAELIQQWKLPIFFQKTVAFHLNPSESNEFPVETAIIHLAYKIVTQMNDERNGILSPLDISEQTWLLLGIDEQQALTIKNESKQHLVESMKLLLTNPIDKAA